MAQSRWPELNGPRESVSWYDAVAFCRWLSAKTMTSIRLPTEWEWQQAATGGNALREYPWEGGWDASRCNSDESGLRRTTAVGMYPQGATAHGVLDMAGTVCEWCLNEYASPERPEAIQVNNEGGQRVIRGGSWYDFPEFLRVSLRLRFTSDLRTSGVGFRLVQDIS